RGGEVGGTRGGEGGLNEGWRGRFRVDCETGWKEWKKKVENAKRVLPEDVLATITGAGYLAASMRGYEAEEALDLGILAASKARLDAVPSLEELTGGELKSIEETVAVPTRKVNVNKRIDHERSDIREVAEYLMTEGHGILAADESGGSIKKKFDAAGIVDDFQNRHDYRRVFLEAAGTEEYLTGVILFDETARDVADDGTPYPEYLAKKGIIPGVKVDQGLVDFGEEKVTKGLDGLDERLAEYRGMGCRFAKWRAAFEITKETPTPAAISANAKILAEYAASCQKNDIVPIVEPEVVYDGEYTLEDSARATVKILRELFKELAAAGVDLRAAILKTNMVLAGKKMKVQTPAEMVGKATALALRAAVPDELAGVVFLSGGQTPAQATENLHAIVENGPYNWGLTFSFARALQDPALDAWQGDNARVEEAREAFMARLAMVAGALRK
ncbi:fructose-bisphosphate aldolase class I, partial [Candidatus Saccharibacteria bacterium]|nr:fructose-bisphosphate aldolase class I [Candidatus Saccharibacteria bacterium]